MYFKEFIELGVTVETTADMETSTEVNYNKVFANKLSVFRKEYYDAKKVGLKPEIGFEVRLDEYIGQTRLRHDGKEYYLIRNGENQKNDMIELFFSSDVGAKNEYE